MKVYNINTDKNLNIELKNELLKIRTKRNFNPEKYIKNKANLLNLYMKKSKLSGCVFGVSGGIDSSVVLGIINYASKQEDSPIKKIIPLMLPVKKSIGLTNQIEATDKGILVCNHFNVKPNILDLSFVNEEIRKVVENNLEIIGDEWAIGQLGPYSRTPVSYYITSLLSKEGYGSLVCGTINKDEGAYLGYVGKASDGMVDLQIITDIHKSEVYSIAKHLNIPEIILNSPPNGDMYDGRVDEEVFGASYDFVELYLNFLNYSEEDKFMFLNNLSIDAKDQFCLFAKNLENLHSYNAHKYLVGSPAFHLDLFDSRVKGGWDINYSEKIKKILGDF